MYWHQLLDQFFGYVSKHFISKLFKLFLLYRYFFHTTKHISHSKFLTLEDAVTIYNWLINEIENFQDDANIKIEVKTAALQAMEKLKKYYKYTDALPYTVTT